MKASNRMEYYVRRHKHLRRLCRLLLNLTILSLLAFLVWFGIVLFGGQWEREPLVGGVAFVGALVVLIGLSRLAMRNCWQPSMKLTVIALVVLFLVFAFAGVEPMVEVKNTLVDKVGFYVARPLDVSRTLDDVHISDGGGYNLRVSIDPTDKAELNRMYIVRVSSPYWERDIEWDVMWADARGLHEVTRTVYIGRDDPLGVYLGHLAYRASLQALEGRMSLREIEADFYRELDKLITIRVVYNKQRAEA